MTGRRRFASRLYGQIVYPLLAVALVVGVVATVVAVYFLDELTTRWVSDSARDSTTAFATRFEHSLGIMESGARAIGSSAAARSALAEGDLAEVGNILRSERPSLDSDAVVLIDADQRVLASAGLAGLGSGTQPITGLRPADLTGSRLTLARVGKRYAVVAPYRVVSGSDPYTILVINLIDTELLRRQGGSRNTAFALYTADGQLIARTMGEDLRSEEIGDMSVAFARPNRAILSLIDSADTAPERTRTLRTESGESVMSVDQIHFANGNSPPQAYVIGAVSKELSRKASETTRSLIAMWSVVAVLTLIVFGGWLARRVSDPLVELSESARRIAEGDFGAKVAVPYSNEIGDLAEAFNQMTDSLGERSETLTKKILELAALYEMSRGLGSTLEMDELLSLVLDSALRLFNVESGYIVLRDLNGDGVRIRAIRGAASPDHEAVRDSMSEWVVREGRPLIFNPETAGGDGRVDEVTGARAALCVPLVSPNEGTVGSITIATHKQKRRFSSDDVRLLATIANHATMAVGNIELFSSLQEAYLTTVRSLAAAVDAKDAYTRGHSDRVALYATLTVDKMGLSHDQRIATEMAAYLHDIGKIGVPEEILLKPGGLDDDERAQMRHHPLIGANILKPVSFPWAIVPVVRHHHESFDGTGYPAGLKGEEIPLLARIITVADSYEAMTADRPYREGRDPDVAMSELRRCSGKQFDPRVVEVFAQVIDELESGIERQASDLGEVATDEARAVFAAMVDGVFLGFRKLGGPRLSANVESEIDSRFNQDDMPFRIRRGRLSFTDDPSDPLDVEVARMREALHVVDAVMTRVSGGSLTEHFYEDAVAGLSVRMRRLSRELGFFALD